MAGALRRARMPLQPLTPRPGTRARNPVILRLGRYCLYARSSQGPWALPQQPLRLSPAVPQALPCSQCQSPPCKLQLQERKY